MRCSAGRTVLFSFLILVLLLNDTSAAADVTDFQVDSTDLRIYRDGLVRITQTLTVNETMPVISFPIFGGSSINSSIVLDENNTVLDYEIGATDLSVFTLGTTHVSVQYDTNSLTSKDAEVWTFLVNTPYNVTVFLPEDSTIVYLNGVPNSIDINENIMSLSLFAGFWEISYTFPLNPPASFLVSNLKVSPAEILPNEEVSVSVTVTNIGGQTGSYSVPLLVNQVKEDTKLVTLAQGGSTSVEFKVSKQNLGTYTIDVDGLVHTFTVTEVPSNPVEHSDSIPLEYLVSVAVVAVVVVVVLFFVTKRKGPNTEIIFKTHPQLNPEEKSVIQFLVDHGGKAFESQIREKFPDIPRTSLWRLVKRLERLEIVKVKKIGLENQVQLKK
jgi:uncharacterized membrane protein